MADNTKPKSLTFITLFIGAFGILLLDIGCILDWIKKVSLDVGYLVNVFYHPLSGVIAIACFFLIIVLFLEKGTPGRIQKMVDYLEEKKKIPLIFLVITLISAVLLVVNSVLLLSETKAGTSNVGILTIFHALLGVILAVSLMIAILKTIMSPYLSGSDKWQKHMQIVISVVFVVLLVLVIIGMAVGWIIL